MLIHYTCHRRNIHWTNILNRYIDKLGLLLGMNENRFKPLQVFYIYTHKHYRLNDNHRDFRITRSVFKMCLLNYLKLSKKRDALYCIFVLELLPFD